jgi:hypothetical protein
MKKTIGLVAFSIVLAALAGLAAEKPSDKPDPEMLRMIEFLKDWEMFKNMELLKEMQRIGKQPTPSGATAQNFPAKQKEIAK